MLIHERPHRRVQMYQEGALLYCFSLRHDADIILGTMPSVNRVTLLGHLGKDPDVRHTQSGQAVAELSLATTERWKDKQGSKQERTEWHRVVAWGPKAEFAGKYMSKGTLVYVEGSLETQTWDDRDGNKRYTTQIRASTLEICDRPPAKGRPQEQSQESFGNSGVFGGDDDLPF